MPSNSLRLRKLSVRIPRSVAPAIKANPASIASLLLSESPVTGKFVLTLLTLEFAGT